MFKMSKNSEQLMHWLKKKSVPPPPFLEPNLLSVPDPAQIINHGHIIDINGIALQGIWSDLC